MFMIFDQLERKVTMKGSVRKKGNSWYYSFDVSKKGEKRKRIERLGGKTKKEADAALREAIQKFEEEQEEENDMTILDLMKIRIEKYEPAVSKTTTILKKKDRIRWFNYEENLNISFFDPLLIEKLQAFINQLSLHYAQKTYEQVRNDIRSAFHYGVDHMNLIPSSNIKLLKLPKKPKKPRKAIYSETEIQKLLESSNPNLRMLLKLMFGTGLRIGEAIALEVGNIYFEKNLIVITKTFARAPNINKKIYNTPKTENSFRAILISDDLSIAMQQYLQTRKTIPLFLKENKDYWEDSESGIPFDPFIRTRIGTAMKYDGVLECFKRLYKKTGIKLLSHSFRRTHASILHEQNLPTENIAKRLGHASLETTEKYIFETENAKDKIIEILKKKNM